jgi:hypothetical protein
MLEIRDRKEPNRRKSRSNYAARPRLTVAVHSAARSTLSSRALRAAAVHAVDTAAFVMREKKIRSADFPSSMSSIAIEASRRMPQTHCAAAALEVNRVIRVGNPDVRLGFINTRCGSQSSQSINLATSETTRVGSLDHPRALVRRPASARPRHCPRQNDASRGSSACSPRSPPCGPTASPVMPSAGYATSAQKIPVNVS